MDLEALQASAFVVWLAGHAGWALPLIALLACAESFALVGVAVPGVVLLGASALFCSVAGIPLWQVLVAAWAGAVLGDGASFAIGRAGRRQLRARRRRRLRWMARCEPLVARYGWMAVAGARFVGPLRPVMPLVAGLLGMRPVAFAALNLATAAPWSVVYIGPGYWLGRSAGAGTPDAWLLAAAAAAAAAIGGGLYWLRRRLLGPDP